MEATFTPDAALQVCPNLRKGGAVSHQPAPVTSPAPHPLVSENLFCPTFKKKHEEEKSEIFCMTKLIWAGKIC